MSDSSSVDTHRGAGNSARRADDINLRGFINDGQFIGVAAFRGDAGDGRYVRATGGLSGGVNGDGRADWPPILANTPVLTATHLLF
jgi:hypothetical protein